MKMKKIFLILVAAVALSSCATKPYGEKSRADSAGDIVFADSTATAWREGLTLTDAQSDGRNGNRGHGLLVV